MLPGQRERVELGERAGRQLGAQAGGAVEARVRAALGVRDQHAEAALTQLCGGVVEAAADALERGFHQHPARPRWPLRDQLQLALAHAADQLVAELRAAAHLERDRRGVERAAQLHHAGVDLDRVGDAEVGAEVRRHDDRAGALGDGRAGELEAGLHVGGPVVHVGEQVEVQVGVWHHRSASASRSGIR